METTNYIVTETIIDDMFGIESTNRYQFINKQYVYQIIFDNFCRLIKLLDGYVYNSAVQKPCDLKKIFSESHLGQNLDSPTIVGMKNLRGIIYNQFDNISVNINICSIGYNICSIDYACYNCFYDKSIFIPMVPSKIAYHIKRHMSKNDAFLKIMEQREINKTECSRIHNYILNDGFFERLFTFQTEAASKTYHYFVNRNMYDQRLLMSRLGDDIIALLNLIEENRSQVNCYDEKSVLAFIKKLYFNENNIHITNVINIHKWFQHYASTDSIMKSYANTLSDCFLKEN